MGPGAELEHHGREVERLDGPTRRAPLVCQLTKRRAHEHAESLIGRADRLLFDGRGTHHAA